MPIPTVVRSTDPGAPVLNGLPGSAYEVMKHSLELCGWTLEYDDPENFTCALRNNPITGSGCYVRIVDDGDVGTTLGKGHTFELTVYEDMTDVNAGIGPCASPTNSIYMKSFTLNSSPRDWIIIGDDRTCYFSCQNTRQTDTGSQSRPMYTMAGFGDYENWFPGLPGCMQTGSYERYMSGSNYKEYQSRGVHSNYSENCSISRNPANLELTTTSFNYSDSIPRAPRTNNAGIGGDYAATNPDHTVRRYNFPLILNSSSHMTIGVMRGALGPQTNMNSSELGDQHTFSDSSGAYDTVLITGSSVDSGGSGQRRGNLLINLGDWDDFS